MGIRQGKILDFNYTSRKISEDLKDLEKETDKIFTNISVVQMSQKFLVQTFQVLKS